MTNIIEKNDIIISFKDDLINYLKNELKRQIDKNIFDNIDEFGEIIQNLTHNYDYDDLILLTNNNGMGLSINLIKKMNI